MRELSLPKIKKIKIDDSKLEKISLILIFLSMILIGSDRISLSIYGFTVRFVQVILVLESLILIIQGKYKIVLSIPIVSVIVSHLISTIFSYDLKESIAYNFWLIYNFIFVLYVFYSYAKNNSKEKVINLLLLSFLIQSIYIYIQFTMGLFGFDDPFFPMQNYFNIYRPAIWFYEPSYLATYFSAYLAISFYLLTSLKKKKYIYHTINSILSIVVITSSTGYLAIGFSIMLISIINIRNIMKINKKVLVYILLTIITLGVLLYILDLNFINVFLGRIFTSGISQASGGRVQSWKETFDVFLNNPFIGIGPNAYPVYSNTGLPPYNVSLELLANVGMVGFIAFYSFFINIIFTCYKSGKEKNNHFNISIVMGLIVFIVTLQANQNYMRLYLWMLLGIALGFSRNNKKY